MILSGEQWRGSAIHIHVPILPQSALPSRLSHSIQQSSLCYTVGPCCLPITSWEIDGETVADFIFGGSKITADGDCSNEIKRRLLLGRKVMTNLDSILKSRDITLPTKVRLVKAMVFPVVIYGYESWTVKKAKRWRIDAFETVVLEKSLESP